LLFPSSSDEAPRALTAEEETRRTAHRTTAERKLRMARLLGEAGMDDEVRAPGLDAVLVMARALAIENRLPEPSKPEEAVSQPLSRHWGSALDTVQKYIHDPAFPWRPAIDALQATVSESARQSR
jgi:hypothetical protein